MDRYSHFIHEVTEAQISKATYQTATLRPESQLRTKSLYTLQIPPFLGPT